MMTIAPAVSGSIGNGQSAEHSAATVPGLQYGHVRDLGWAVAPGARAGDANGFQIGGGGVESFAFSLGLTSFQPSTSMPYVEETSYVPYQGATHPNVPLYRNNQVFPREAFWNLLNNLWTASGNGTYQPPMYAQLLITVANPWFNVQAGRSVTVLCVYLWRAQARYHQLSPEVQNILGPFDHMLNNFPHYSTLDTELTATETNLLANFMA
jgi:hypothetical protein